MSNWSEEFVRQHERQHDNGLPYLRHGSDQPRWLLVALAPWRNPLNYNYIRTLYQPHAELYRHMVCLHLRDPEDLVYSREPERWLELIQDQMAELKLTSSRLFLMGGSLGGTAAIRFGCQLAARGLFLTNPHFRQDLLWDGVRDLFTPSGWGLPTLLHMHRPQIWLESSTEKSDRANAQALCDACQALPGWLYWHRLNRDRHDIGELSWATIEHYLPMMAALPLETV